MECLTLSAPVVAIVLALTLLLSGCASSPRKAKPPAATSRAGEVHVEQTGDAAKPATAASTTRTVNVPIPEGSKVVFNDELGTAEVTLSQQSIMTTTTRADTVTGPQSFTPPAPPTPADEAKGKAALWLRLGLVAGLAIGGFGLVKGWDLLGIGGGAIAAACFIGLSVDAIPVWLWVLFGIGGALAVAGPALWHLRLKKLPSA